MKYILYSYHIMKKILALTTFLIGTALGAGALGIFRDDAKTGIVP